MKDRIEKRIKELKDAKANLIGQINAINGAIEVLEELLKDEPEKKEE